MCVSFAKCAVFLALSSVTIGGANAVTTVISDLSELGVPDETLNALNTNLPTFNNRTVNGVTAVDIKDATFALSVDFASPAGTSSQNHVLWETGGGTIGFSLVYVPITSTLTLRHASNSGVPILRVDRLLSPEELSGGNLELVWTFDADGDSGVRPEIELYVDKISAGTDMLPNTVSDWSGGNLAGLGGVGGGGIAAGGGNTNLTDVTNFADGTINYTTGLRFWADTDATFIPEPSTLVLLFGGLGLTLFRRRRN